MSYHKILRLPDKTKVEYLVKKDDLIKKITGEYSVKIVDILLKMLEKIERWNLEGLKKEIIENDRVHIIEMIYITQKYFEIYPELHSILNIEEIIIKIAIHDLGEVGVGDLSYNEQLGLTNDELKKHNKKEQKFALKLIGTLNKVNIPKEKIEKLKKYYIEYEQNKKNPNTLNDHFVKFIDIYQAFIHIINHLDNLEELEEKPIFNDFQKLKEYNKPFKELGFDLLYNFTEIINNTNISKEDIIEILYKK